MKWILLITLILSHQAFAGDYTQTKYPLVLVPGMFGFERIAGIDYWYNIPKNLERDGATVFTIDVAGLNTPEFRGEQVIEQVEDILAITGAEKVNLFGHSHGSPTIRYVAAVRPDIVASVTGIAGVNHGVASVDDFVGEEGSNLQNFIGWFGNGMGLFVNALSGANDEQDFLASITSMGEQSMTEFNQRYPQGVPETFCGEGEAVVNGIHYYSFSGTDPTTNIFDISDAFMALANLTYSLQGQQSDGLVERCVSHLGWVIRDDYKMNHLDPMNWVFGLTSSQARPIAIYRAHANRLKNAGL